jgi:hypothetical protein
MSGIDRVQNYKQNKKKLAYHMHRMKSSGAYIGLVILLG